MDRPPPYSNNSGFKTRQQIAGEYGIDPRTLDKMLEREGIKLPRGSISPKLQKIIYKALGDPPRFS